ncbi:MAG: cytochrome c3 family protein [Deltaproteobacteria bacterium]|nr:cytochrome c3 family protein [Deltaproteobacteria bacterium]MBW2305365.1 cytochrome c3 family protein [Deltaproteobacteria bacterium]
MWKKAMILALVVGFAFAGVMAIAADPKVPDSVDLGKYAKKRPKAVFDHNKHVDDIKIDCNSCHHTMKEAEPVKTCNAQGCHGEKKEGDKPGLTGMKNAFHGSCLACHKKQKKAGKKSPTKCSACHVKT